jgi:secreted trypsin-like serine protease
LTGIVFGNGEVTSSAGFTGLTTAFGEVFPEGTTAQGDSGGPLFLFNEDRQRWELAGVTSFGLNPLYPPGFNREDSRYGDLSFFSDVSAQGDWLDSVMIPECSTAFFCFAGSFLFLSRRRKVYHRARGFVDSRTSGVSPVGIEFPCQ